MPLVYPSLEQITTYSRDQLLFLYRNLPTAYSPSELEVIREISILIGPNPVPDLIRQVYNQTHSSSPDEPVSYTREKGSTSRFKSSVTIDADCIEEKEKSVFLRIPLNPIKYGMLPFKNPYLNVWFPRSKVNRLKADKWEVDKFIFNQNMSVSFSKYRDYVSSSYRVTIKDPVCYIKGGIEV